MKLDELKVHFENILDRCRSLFLVKLEDYGPAWSCFRVPTIADKILIKAKRIRNLESLGGSGKIPDSIDSEYMGIANYCIVAIAILENEGQPSEILHQRWSDADQARSEYDRIAQSAIGLVLNKNHDYDNAWLDMSLSSFSDEILSRMSRVKHMNARRKDPTASEGLTSQFQDTLNYAILAYIRLAEAR